MSEISAIITTHAEGDLIHASMQSCFVAIDALVEQNESVSVEVLLVMDRPSDATRKAVSQYASRVDVVEFDFGDQGLVRNKIAEQASGQYIAFLDGDDLWSENWLNQAYQLAILDGECVVYPEFNWYFEGSSNILCQNDDSVPAFDYEALRVVNLWDALCFCPKRIYHEFAFVDRKIDAGFAFEDWHWNRQLFEAGITQKTAKDTIIFKRRRIGSQGAQASRRGVLAEPTKSCFYEFYDEI